MHHSLSRPARRAVAAAIVAALLTAATVATASPASAATRVEQTQAQLAQLGYYPGPVDGISGSATRSAVVAFQKVHGLVPDGIAGPLTRAALAAPVTPVLRGGTADRVEVDLDRQVLYLVQGGALVRIMPVSSGNGAPYTTASGGTAYGVTPVGSFRVQRRIAGERHAPLGVLHDPLYFHRGWAIHGSDSVPVVPASHGCVRVSRANGRELFAAVPDGFPVVVVGGDAATTFSP